jgi:hypothetical protein
MALSFEEFKALRSKGLSPEQITVLDSTGAPAENTRTGAPDPGIRQPLPQWLAQMIPHLLPAAGMTLATLNPEIGLPAMMLRGGLGMLAGEGAKMGALGAQGQPQPNVLPRLGGAFVSGMGGGLLGGLGAKLAPSRGIAEGMAQRSFNPTEEIMRDYPGSVRAALEAGITNTPAGKALAQTNVEAAAAASKSARLGSSARLTPRDVAESALKQAEDAMGRPLTAIEERGVIRQVQQDFNSFLRESASGALRGKKPGSYNASQVAAVTRRAGKTASPGYRAGAKGTPIPASDAANLASGGRAALNRAIPGYEQLQAQVKTARGVNAMVTKAQNRPMPTLPAKIDITQFPPVGSLRPDIASQIAAFAYRGDPYAMAILRQLLARVPQAGVGVVQSGLDQPGGGR